MSDKFTLTLETLSFAALVAKEKGSDLYDPLQKTGQTSAAFTHTATAQNVPVEEKPGPGRGRRKPRAYTPEQPHPGYAIPDRRIEQLWFPESASREVREPQSREEFRRMREARRKNRKHWRSKKR